MPLWMYIVVMLLGSAFAASLFMLWTIIFRLRSHLVSVSYKFILVGKVGMAILTGSGVWLILFPLPQRNAIIQLLWFTIFALGNISLAIGYYLYSRDVNAVLESDHFTQPLPAIPPPVDLSIHKTEDHPTDPPAKEE